MMYLLLPKQNETRNQKQKVNQKVSQVCGNSIAHMNLWFTNEIMRGIRQHLERNRNEYTTYQILKDALKTLTEKFIAKSNFIQKE